MRDSSKASTGEPTQNAPSGRDFNRPRAQLRERVQSYEKGRVSVIIPSYNSELYVGEAIDSALAQSWSNLEVIVVDDGSADGSREIIKGYGDRIQTLFLDHRGAAAARNRGLETATGEFIQFLDADDILLPDAVANRLGSFGEGIDAVFGDLEFFENHSSRTTRVTSHEGWPGAEPLAHLIENNFYTEAPLHRRRVLYEVGGFDESLPCSQELDIHIRLFLGRTAFSYLPGIVARARIHSAPDRIENTAWYVENPDLHLRIAEHHLKLIADRDPTLVSPAVTRAFARKLWSRGVIAGRNGAFRVARRHFQRAASLDPNIQPEGSATFRLLNTTFGPLAATWLLFQKKRFSRLLKSRSRPQN